MITELSYLGETFTIFPVLTVPRDEQYHGCTYQRISRKAGVLPDPECWTAHWICYHSAYYHVCWRHQSGVEREQRTLALSARKQTLDSFSVCIIYYIY